MVVFFSWWDYSDTPRMPSNGCAPAEGHPPPPARSDRGLAWGWFSRFTAAGVQGAWSRQQSGSGSTCFPGSTRCWPSGPRRSRAVLSGLSRLRTTLRPPWRVTPPGCRRPAATRRGSGRRPAPKGSGSSGRRAAPRSRNGTDHRGRDQPTAGAACADPGRAARRTRRCLHRCGRAGAGRVPVRRWHAFGHPGGFPRRADGAAPNAMSEPGPVRAHRSTPPAGPRRLAGNRSGRLRAACR